MTGESPVTLVDSCVLLDVQSGAADESWIEWSERALARVADEGELVINPILYGEVAPGFRRIEDLDAALPPTRFRREPLPYAAAFLASRVLGAHRARGGRSATALPDMLIGAHAAVANMRVLTRDTRRFRQAYPRLVLVSPDGPT